ncbi:protein of unknown function [Serratia sp. Tan611]|nr:protein of unknown function [Serratia sp. Tan611]
MFRYAQLEPYRSFSSSPCVENYVAFETLVCVESFEEMVVGEGFEPSKSVTADLQSAPFGRSGTPP